MTTITTLITLWCIIGFLISSIAMADNYEGYNFKAMILSALLGWLFGLLFLIWAIATQLPRLLHKPFNYLHNKFEKYLE